MNEWMNKWINKYIYIYIYIYALTFGTLGHGFLISHTEYWLTWQYAVGVSLGKRRCDTSSCFFARACSGPAVLTKPFLLKTISLTVSKSKGAGQLPGQLWLQHSDFSPEPPPEAPGAFWRGLGSGSNLPRGMLISGQSVLTISKSHYVSKSYERFAFVHPPQATTLLSVRDVLQRSQGLPGWALPFVQPLWQWPF